MLILSVVLILMYQQRNDFSNQDEIARLQRDILNFISKDDALRGQILSNQLYGTDEKVKLLLPYGYQYYLKLCNYNDICSLGCYVKGEVYSYETLIVANLTYYVPEQAKKLKLFMWYGAWPDGCARSNYTAPFMAVCGNGKCEVGESFASCPIDCLAPHAVLSLTWGNLRKNFGTQPSCNHLSDDWYYYDMSITETSGQAGTVFGSRTRCYLNSLGTTTCDPLKTTMPSGMPSSISAGQTVTVNDRWFCVVPGYTYNVTEAFYNDSSGANMLFNYTIANVD